MTEPRRRPILHLKLGTVVRPLGPAASEALAKPAAAKPAFAKSGVSKPYGRPPAPPPPSWKCRPCGTAFTPPADAADEDAVRCPSCNAKLGLAGEFRQETPNLERLRARPVKR